jgi:hypothetical protein
MAKQIALLRDVIYLMSRTQASHETHVFFKIQSIGTHAISLWRQAFPDVPWVFVYRDPVEVLVSHLKHGGDEAKRAACLRSRPNPTPRLIHLVEEMQQQHHSTESITSKTVDELSNVEFCAAHLATLCQAAIEEYQNNNNGNMGHGGSKGQFVNYASLPDIMWESVLPNHFDTEDLSEQHIERMKNIAGVYSKGFQKKANMPWSQDTDTKQERASEAMRQAAKTYLAPYFEKLEQLANHVSENDEENNPPSPDSKQE